MIKGSKMKEDFEQGMKYQMMLDRAKALAEKNDLEGIKAVFEGLDAIAKVIPREEIKQDIHNILSSHSTYRGQPEDITELVEGIMADHAISATDIVPVQNSGIIPYENNLSLEAVTTEGRDGGIFGASAGLVTAATTVGYVVSIGCGEGVLLATLAAGFAVTFAAARLSANIRRELAKRRFCKNLPQIPEGCALYINNGEVLLADHTPYKYPENIDVLLDRKNRGNEASRAEALELALGFKRTASQFIFRDQLMQLSPYMTREEIAARLSWLGLYATESDAMEDMPTILQTSFSGRNHKDYSWSRRETADQEKFAYTVDVFDPAF